MSYNESKMVLRGEIPHLKGKSRGEAFEYFQNILGEPDILDDWDGEVEYFNYEPENHKFVPVQENTGRSTDDNRWGVDYIIGYNNGYGEERGKDNVSLEELNKIVDEMTKKFEIDPKSIRIFSYSWYNGTDEPIYFD